MKTRTPLQGACRRYEEDLVLHYYGDNSENERREVERHLAACDSCRCFLDDLRKLLPQMTQAQEMPQSFWDNYYRETVSKLASYEERKYSWRSLFAPLRTWMIPAFGTLAVAVLVIGMLGKDDLGLFVEPRVPRIPQEILADKNQLEFFESMDILEALSR
ncbi:MAG TPA: zf-HC2 domain-containing protein, partial [Candidatus Binatia bacterium]|nr:zf-HC2 domain-containing protein [Candidatus Binatia bacterium]